jgi:general secretion pathway protein D
VTDTTHHRLTSILVTPPLHRRRLTHAAAFFLLAATLHAQTAETVSPRQAREADNAYLDGARLLSHNDPVAAERSFARAVQLDPSKTEYALSLAVAKQHHVTALVQQGAKARLLGHDADAARLFAEAAALDPDNRLVTQHLDSPILFDQPADQSVARPVSDALARLGGPIQLTPTPGTHSFHTRGDSQQRLREVYTAYGIRPTLDPSVTSQTVRLDLDDADFATAARIAQMMTHTFAVPLLPASVLLAKDTQENRDRLVPQVEETFFLPALPPEQLTELSNIAKNIFDLKQVTVQATTNRIVMRGNEDAMKLVNITFSDILDGSSDVVLDIHLYEVDRSNTHGIGATLPSSAGVFGVAPLLQQLVNQNQTLINQGIAAGLIDTSKGYFQTLVNELLFLSAAGINIPQLSNLLGVFGNFGSYVNANGQTVGLPLGGVFLGSGATFNFALNSSEVRTLDAVQMRSGDRQLSVFRSGVRYPITTATYTSGVSSSLASALSGVKINGQDISALLKNTSSLTIPQIQFEDLGLTLKATPQVLKAGGIFIHLDMKIEALGSGTVDGIPILDSRQLTSDVTIPEGQTAMLVSLISNSEQNSISGLPGLSEIPGFQGTDHNVQKDTTELLITITPHLARRPSSITATRRLLANVSPKGDQ